MRSLRSFPKLGALVASSFALAASARAQMLGAPVLQNAFTNRGFTVGVDFGAAKDVTTYGGAVAWSPMNEHFQLSGGVAYLDEKNASGTATYGARLMVPVLDRTSAFGVAPFVGMGGANFDGVNEWQIPLGITAGYRRSLGASGRGVSAYLSPFYTWYRIRENGSTHGTGFARVSIGVDAAVLPQVGVTVGIESGQTADEGQSGPTRTIFGVGVSYSLHKPGTGTETGKARRTKATPATAPDATPPATTP